MARRWMPALCTIALGAAALPGASAEPPPAFAAVQEDSGEDLEALSLEQLLEVPVYSPTKLPQPAHESTGAVSLVTREMIEAYGWLSLNDILYALPGFHPSAEFERRTVGARGLYEPWGNNRLLLLFDGIAHNDPVTGTAYTWELTPLFLAESIEVVRGPTASLYGPNAMNGTIAINSVKPTKPFVRADARVGSFGRRVYQAMSGTQTNLASVLLAYSWDAFAGEPRRSYDLSSRRGPDGSLLQFSTREARASTYFLAKADGSAALEGFSLQFHDQAWEYESRLGYILFIPDAPDTFSERRQWVTAAYRTPDEDARWQHEYVLRLQRHAYQWNVRLVPGDAFTSHPAGITEGLAYEVDELFARAQVSVGAPAWGRLVTGAEYSLLLYSGDKEHTINVDLAGNPENGFPPQLDSPVHVGPFLEGMAHRPLHRMGIFAELVSARLLNELVSFTAGARYDSRFFHYLDVFDPARPVRFSSFQQLSPRLTALLYLTPRFTARASLSWAFRDPAADELFASNSLLAVGGVGRLRPESSTTAELGLSYQLSKGLRAQATGFHETFRDQIGYSSESITRNLYSRRTAGLESELLWATRLGGVMFSGFANYTFVRLLDEEVSDPVFTSQLDRLTWAPAHTAKGGLTASWHGLTGALVARYQGAVFRKDSDLQSAENRQLRPDVLAPWVVLDLAASFQVTREVTARVKVANLLDARGHLVKIQDAPFDFPIDGRQVWAGVELRL